LLAILHCSRADKRNIASKLAPTVGCTTILRPISNSKRPGKRTLSTHIALPTRHPLAQPADVGLDAGRLGRISTWMRRYVDEGKLPFALVMLARRDRVAFFDCYGQRDMAAATPVEADTVVRIYSMSKPVTTVAALMLYEQGAFALDDPVARYLPALGNLQVFVGGDADNPQTEDATHDFTVRELMTHTAGLTYGFIRTTPVDEIYRRDGIDFADSDRPLADLVTRLAQAPLLCQPGSQWNYSVATDVLGHLVEVCSGMDLDRYLREHVLGPLAMHDTGFHVAQANHRRFAANYQLDSAAALAELDPSTGGRFTRPATTFSGGGGLVSTAEDYMRFARMLMRGGELDGVRLLGRKTVELMTSNHLPGDMAAMGQPRFSESNYEGIGFGLGVSVTLDPARAQILGSAGEYAWGGAASTAFWADPSEQQIVIFMTQLMPSSTWPVRRELRVLSYQAIID
jgi:CubicO group peptidase (beta-lactamase class C family)